MYTARFYACWLLWRASAVASMIFIGGSAGSLELAIFDKTATNPAARISAAMARFCELAPDVRLSVHIGSINGIDRGLLDGAFHVGVVPTHRNSNALAYTDLFGETMLLYCGAGHPLFETKHLEVTAPRIRSFAFAGLGYHSPNMEVSHKERLQRAATGYDQEAIATLVLSGRYLGFLPDHYADSFVRAGALRAVNPARFRYSCRFASVVCRTPEPSRAALVFESCLREVHSAGNAPH